MTQTANYVSRNETNQENGFSNRPEVYWAQLFLASNLSAFLPSYKIFAKSVLAYSRQEDSHGFITVGFFARVGCSVIHPELHKTLRLMQQKDNLIEPLTMVAADRFVSVTRPMAFAEYLSSIVACGGYVTPLMTTEGELAGCTISLRRQISIESFCAALKNIDAIDPLRI